MNGKRCLRQTRASYLFCFERLTRLLSSLVFTPCIDRDSCEWVEMWLSASWRDAIDMSGNCWKKRRHYATAFLSTSFPLALTSMFFFLEMWFKNNLHNQFLLFVAWIILSLSTVVVVVVVVVVILIFMLYISPHFDPIQRGIVCQQMTRPLKRDGFWCLYELKQNVNISFAGIKMQLP